MKIGVMVESFRKGFEEGCRLAASVGAQGIQMYATDDEKLAWGEKEIAFALETVKSNGLVFSALCGDLGHGFGDEEKNPWLVERSKKIVDLALKLNCSVVTTHIGVVPAEECRKKEVMRAACRELALYADSVGASFAVETGPETAVILADFLDSLGASGVRVNFDPANLVMCVDDIPEEAVKTLGKFIVHTHAKDGISKAKANGEILEVPLGTGDVNFDKYLPALKGTGFDGFLTIEREVGENPVADIAMAADFLKEKIAAYSL